MKLVVCHHCFDWAGLFPMERSCRCGRAGGWIDKTGDVYVWGPCEIAHVTGADNGESSGRWRFIDGGHRFSSKQEAHSASRNLKHRQKKGLPP